MMRQVAYIAIQRFPVVLWVVFDSCQFRFCFRVLFGKEGGGREREMEWNGMLYLLYYHAIGFAW